MKKTTKFLIFSIIGISVFAILNSPIFLIGNVYINGAEQISEEKVLKAANLGQNNGNIFYYPTRRNQRKLEENSYIEKADIKRIFPNTIEVNIIERLPIAYIEYRDTYLSIDKKGNVIEVLTETSSPNSLPIVMGLNINSYTLGNPINLDKTEYLKTTLILSNLLEKHNITSETLRIDLKDLNNIYIYIENMVVVFGNMENADEKISRVIASIEPMREKGLNEYKGFYYVDDISKDSYFQLLK
ncbi:MAG: cell division protein FtsQ/DivIB [Lachnospirales bacterium]